MPAEIFIEKINIIEVLFNFSHILWKIKPPLKLYTDYKFFANVDLNDPDAVFVEGCKLLGLLPVWEYSEPFSNIFSEYSQNLNKFYYKDIYPLYDSNFYKYIYSCSFYPKDNMPALIQLYHYSIGICVRLKEMWDEITPLKINWKPAAATIYYDSYPQVVESVFNLIDYTNAYGQRYNIQWDWDWYNSWLFELNHQNISSWKYLNAWVIQPRRLSPIVGEYLYPVLNCLDIYNFEDAVDITEKKISAKIKFKSYRKHFYLLNNGVSDIYLKHRDYIQGPSVAITNWWWNTFSSKQHDLTSYRQQGLIFCWYEHFYSIEIPLKVLWANWYQSILPTWMHTTIGQTLIPNEVSWQIVTRPTHFILKAWRWVAISDEHEYTLEGDRIFERDEADSFTYDFYKMMWSNDPDFDYDNSYAKELERKKFEEFLDLKDMINTSRYVYKDPFADHYVPGNNFN